MYIKQIDDFSAKELRPIFDRHISKSASITTDLWRGYKPKIIACFMLHFPYI